MRTHQPGCGYQFRTGRTQRHRAARVAGRTSTMSRSKTSSTTAATKGTTVSISTVMGPVIRSSETSSRILATRVMDTGQYGVTINGNLFFDDASECVLFFTYTNYYGVATFGANSTGLTITPCRPSEVRTPTGPAPAPRCTSMARACQPARHPAGATIPARRSGAVAGPTR